MEIKGKQHTLWEKKEEEVKSKKKLCQVFLFIGAKEKKSGFFFVDERNLIPWHYEKKKKKSWKLQNLKEGSELNCVRYFSLNREEVKENFLADSILTLLYTSSRYGLDFFCCQVDFKSAFQGLEYLPIAYFECLVQIQGFSSYPALFDSSSEYTGCCFVQLHCKFEEGF